MKPKNAKKTRPLLNSYPFWAPRFWHGMLLSDWLRLVGRHRYRIDLRRIPMAIIVTLLAAGNSILHRLQQWRYGELIERTEISKPPVFIIGHWRSGTTMLHELIVGDGQFAYPTTYECFMANHFLLTGKLFPRLFWFLLPPKRPMDNMSVSFDHPQEDEFAMVSMGAPSPILKIAFPNDPPPHLEFLDMQDVSDAELAQWKSKLMSFVRAQTFLKGKQLVLKSPPHTGRIAVLSEMFPGAKFIHIVRNPFSLFPSNRRLWKALDEVQGLQIPKHRQLDEFVFTAFERMYRGYEAQHGQLPAGCLSEVRYEDLVADPTGEIRRIYEELALGDFENVRPRIDEYLNERKNYQVNRHDLEPEISDEIKRRWASFLQRYGYSEAPDSE